MGDWHKTTNKEVGSYSKIRIELFKCLNIGQKHEQRRFSSFKTANLEFGLFFFGLHVRKRVWREHLTGVRKKLGENKEQAHDGQAQSTPSGGNSLVI